MGMVLGDRGFGARASLSLAVSSTRVKRVCCVETKRERGLGNWRVDPRCKRGVEGVVIDIFLSVCLVGFPRRRWGDVTTEALHLYRENRLRSQTTPDLQTTFSKASPHTDVRKPR